MNIIICGAGRVGYTIAKLLSEQNHSITVIDQSSEDIQKINESLDVRAIVGKATYPSVLEKANASEADMIIAVTKNDEINMLICQIAFSIFKVQKKIARIRSKDYLNPKFSKVYNKENLPNHENFRFLGTDCTGDFWRLSKTCMCEVSCDCDLSGFHYVFHLASYKKTYPKVDYENKVTSSDVMINNSRMIERILDFCKSDGARLIFTSTSDVYGNHETFKEEDGVFISKTDVERQSYSLVKLFEEQILLNSHSQGDIDVSIARIFGCFSERSNKKWSGGHVPLFIDKALKGKDIIIHGDGKQTRCMSYVSDIVNGLISIMEF